MTNGHSSFEEWKNRTRPTTLTREILEDLSNEAVESAILDFVYGKCPNGDPYNVEAVSALPKGFQHIFAMNVLEGDIRNGGFNQMFWNPTGEFAQQAADGYRAIGARQLAKVLDEAIAIFAAEVPMAQKFFTRGTNEAFSEWRKLSKLKDLDQRYFDALQEENPEELRIAHIRRHLGEFVTSK